MARRCTPVTPRGIATAIDRAFGAVDGVGPYVYLAQPGGLLMEIAVDDAYEMLADLELPAPTIALGLVVEGWAAPFRSDAVSIRPSQHPERMRVRTTTVIGRSGEYSVLRYAGVDEPTAIDGPLEGDLAVAMRYCWDRAMAHAR